MVAFITAVFVDNMQPWDALLKCMASVDVLSHTSVVLIHRIGDHVEARCLVYSQPKYRVWGLDDVFQCWNKACAGHPHDVTAVTRSKPLKNIVGKKKLWHDINGQAKFTCRRCRETTRWIDRPDFVHPIEKYRLMYWYEWPIPPHDMARFTAARFEAILPQKDKKMVVD